MHIPVVFISDDNYIIPTSVAIASMISSKRPETFYDIYIVCASLSEESEAAFSVFASNAVGIHIVREKADRFADLHTFSDTSMCVASPAALIKFALPEIFIQFDKILYLDGDILVRCDLSELYTTELGNNLLAAVKDSSALYKPQYQFVPDYFNSGVMLLNLEQMRAENTKDALIQAKLEHNVAHFMDQNAFNWVCTGRILLLPIRYNLLAVILDKAMSRWTVDNINKNYNTSYLTQNELLENGSIIHFASKDKPWKNPFVRYANEWFDLYRSIPVAHTLPDYPTILNNVSITISLTSYPARIGYVSEVISNLNTQSVKSNRIVLYLAKEQFPEREKALPAGLCEQIASGQVAVHWCDLDLKSHKKYFYAMQEYPDDLIITVDDDEYLPDTAVEELVLCWLSYPKAIAARRTHLITFDRNCRILPYQNWIMQYNALVRTPSMQLMATGCSGVLYPPHLLPAAVFDSQAILECAPCGDDLWLKAHATMQDVPVILATESTSLHHVEGSQESGLYLENQFNGANDAQLQNICRHIDKLYGGNDLLLNKLYSSAIGTNLTSIETLVSFIGKVQGTVRARERKLRQTYDEKSEINRKLQITYGEKFDRGVQIKELKKQIEALKAENAALKSKSPIKKLYIRCKPVLRRVKHGLVWLARKIKLLPDKQE